MEQSPAWEANRSSAGREKPDILWNPKVHYCIHNSKPHLPVLSQINLVHVPLPLPEDHFNIILSSTPESSKWSPSFKTPQKRPVCNPSLSHSHFTLHPYFILLDTDAVEYLFKCTDCKDTCNDSFPPHSFNFLSLMSECSPQQLVVRPLNLCSSINLTHWGRGF